MAQFNIREMPEGSKEQIRDLQQWRGWTKTQTVLIALDRLWQSEKKTQEEQFSEAPKAEVQTS
jgi:hypothetical protein